MSTCNNHLQCPIPVICQSFSAHDTGVDSASDNDGGHDDTLRSILLKEWVNPICHGCGYVIEMKFDGYHRETGNVIRYSCEFQELLGDSTAGFVYFHNEVCETLRKFKESVRKYVLKNETDGSDFANEEEYVRVALNHSDCVVSPSSHRFQNPIQFNANCRSMSTPVRCQLPLKSMNAH